MTNQSIYVLKAANYNVTYLTYNLTFLSKPSRVHIEENSQLDLWHCWVFSVSASTTKAVT